MIKKKREVWHTYMVKMSLIFLLISWGCSSPQSGQPFTYAVLIQDKDSRKLLVNAKVTIYVQNLAPLIDTTDDQGYARFSIDASYSGQPGRLRVEAVDHKENETVISLRPGLLPSIIQLDTSGGSRAEKNSNSSQDEEQTTSQNDQKRVPGEGESVIDWSVVQREVQDKTETLARARKARVLSSGTSSSDTIAKGSSNEYVFAGFTNTPLLFTLQQQGSFWAYIEIFDSHGIRVAREDFSRKMEKIPFTPTNNAPYILRVTGDRNFGDYVIQLSYISGLPSERNKARTLSLNQSQKGTLADGARDHYRFYGTANTPLLFTLQQQGSFWAYIEIFDSHGIRVAKEDFSRKTEKIPFTPKSSDHYVFCIIGDRGFGDYVMVLSLLQG
ncbi:MAG TPA: hypothetical protein VKA70_16445 [Blastocatellia bacterium]|nr:hypothetical protein [Blastocatellia bacterium]